MFWRALKFDSVYKMYNLQIYVNQNIQFIFDDKCWIANAGCSKSCTIPKIELLVDQGGSNWDDVYEIETVVDSEDSNEVLYKIGNSVLSQLKDYLKFKPSKGQQTSQKNLQILNFHINQSAQGSP